MNFYGQPFENLTQLFAEQNLSLEGAAQLYNWHFKKNRREPCRHHNLASRTREYIARGLTFALPAIDTVHESPDKTVKFLFKLHDGKKVETVLIPFQGKYTVCLSSQVGCAMNCSFCFTGTQGFSRHLTTDEIVGQFVEACRWLTEHRPDDDRVLNIVFMGQGEPLHNFEAVRDACRIFISRHGLSLAGHKITVSTSGYIPGLERWKQEMPDVNIALSLHSPFNEKRSQVIPINRRFPVEKVVELTEAIPQGKKRFVTYEYLLLKDFNDTQEDAHATARLLAGKKAMVNLIPFNPYPGASYTRPEMQTVAQFKAILDEYRIPTTIRSTKGDEILAACGQLNTAEEIRA